MSNHLIASDFKATPYWWETAPRPDLGAPSLPAQADVAIIGSGYTGLWAAIQTARGDRHTVVLDAEATGSADFQGTATSIATHARWPNTVLRPGAASSRDLV